MREKKARELRKVAEPLYVAWYKGLLPEGTEITIKQAIHYGPRMWKKVCRKVKKNPSITLEELKL